MNRRRFIRNVGTSGVAVATLPTLIDRIGVRALAGGDDRIGKLLGNTDRVLVIIQLLGGNDGLNTVIPVENPLYHSNRPNLALTKHQTLPLTDTLRWHPAMHGFGRLHSEGKLAVVQGVIYPNPDRSHFRGTDIWLTATDASVFGTTGWIGRYLDVLSPGYPNTLPEQPLAVQIGTSQSLGFSGPKGSMGITFRDPDESYRLVRSGGAIEEVPPADLGQTQAALEVEFMRNIARSADVYAKVVKDIADTAPTPSVTYPQTDLAAKLRVVSQLITGGLKTKVYLVSWDGASYDTHANQVNPTDATTGVHANLLAELSGAVTAFMDDLKNQGHAHRVSGMTFSEFGRRVAENGSLGTDHGTAAPLFVVGEQVIGGTVLGADPDLENLDERGDLLMNYDFRDVYASVLLQWFAEPASLAEQVLYKDFSGSAPPLFKVPVRVHEGANAGSTLGIRSVSPNPASTIVDVRVTMTISADATIEVRNLTGMLVGGANVDAISGHCRVDVSGLASGTYVLTLRSGQSATHSLFHVAR